MSGLPLDGIRVLEITTAMAGPSCTAHLADWGAEAIRVECVNHWQPAARGGWARPPREMIERNRSWAGAYPDWDPGDRPWDRVNVFGTHGRNKLGMTLDLSLPDGLELFHELLKKSDVFIQNNAADVVEKLHVTYDELREVKPDVIVAEMPAYGMSGPYRSFRAYGNHVEGVAGHTALRGYADTDPSSMEATYVADAVGGMTAAFAIVLALRHRRRTGEGQRVEVALAENFIPLMGEALIDYQFNGRIHGPRGNRSRRYAPCGTYRCRGSEHWLNICILTTEQWRTLAGIVGDPALQRPELDRVDHRMAAHDEIDGAISAWTADRDAQELMRLLQGRGIPAGAVQDAAEMYADPQLRFRGFFERLSHAATGEKEYPGLQFKLARVPNAIRRPQPLFGEHNRYVYREILGVSEERYAELERMGHIGDAPAPGIV